MFNQIIFSPILGVPLIAWGGIVTITLFFVGAYYGHMAMKGKAKITKHILIVRIALLLAVIHGSLGIISLF